MQFSFLPRSRRTVNALWDGLGLEGKENDQMTIISGTYTVHSTEHVSLGILCPACVGICPPEIPIILLWTRVPFAKNCVLSSTVVVLMSP